MEQLDGERDRTGLSRAEWQVWELVESREFVTVFVIDSLQLFSYSCLQQHIP